MVLFLAQQDGRAMRIVAKRQNGTVILDIPLTKNVKVQVESEGVVVHDQKILLDGNEDRKQLYSLVEAANLYLFKRTSTHFSVQAFTFWALLVAAKNGCEELLSAWYSSLDLSSPAPVQHDDIESRLYQVTKSLAQAVLEGDGIFGGQIDFWGGKRIFSADMSLLYWAIWIGNAPLVDLLMVEGVTATDNPWHDLPPLHIAALYGHDAVAHAIVANSSEDAWTLARERDQDGYQALNHAAWYGHEKVVRSLLSWGAEVDNGSGLDRRALHVAAAQGHTNVVALLLDKGARVEIPDRLDQTALLTAAEQGHTSVVQLLLENGAREETPNYLHQTALHVAAQHGNANVVQLLLGRGARQDARDCSLKTPLLLACESKRECVISLLAQKQLDLRSETETDGTHGS